MTDAPQKITVLKTYARVFVDDLDTSLPVFEHVVGRPADLRFPFEDAELAAVGDVLLIAAPAADLPRYRESHGPLVVEDVETARRVLLDLGATTVSRFESATGFGYHLRHPDGVVVEYVQWNPDLVARIVHRAATG
ncbi:VOC family protein [Actinokineospora spheciospongiae]|nr:hypothetical protein [Actinokineospora spheciospongiae]